MIHVIILAGGNSNRFNSNNHSNSHLNNHSNKLLYELCGKPLFSYGVDNLGSCKDISVTVVTQYREIADYCRKKDVSYVLSEDCKLGMSYSIRAGMKAVMAGQPERQPEEVIFMGADQPLIEAATIRALYEAYRKSGKGLASSVAGGQPSNPAVFSHKYFEDLNHLSGDRGGRKIINENLQDCFMYEIEDPVQVADVDTIKQLDSVVDILNKKV